MPEPYTANDLLNAIAVASKTLSERKDEINRLNVFPVPDGDTGTNMSLTLETVVENLANLPIGGGRRGNSQGDHDRRAHGRTRKLRCHYLANFARPVRGQRRP